MEDLVLTAQDGRSILHPLSSILPAAVYSPPMGKTTYPPGATFCCTCGYCLFGLPSNICPECGHAFDPADPATFLSRPRRRGIPRAIFWGVLGLLALGLAYGGFLTWLYVGWRAEAGARAVATGPVDKLKTRSILPAELSHLLIGNCRQWQERVDTITVWQDTQRPWHHLISSNDIRAIAACRRLRVLVLAVVSLKPEDVAELSQCRELEAFYLAVAKLHGGDLAPLGGLVRLKKLSVTGNPALGDEDLAPIGKLKELEVLCLGSTGITDEGLAQLSGLSHLRIVTLGYSPNLTDAAVPHLSRLSRLKELYLTSTKLTPAGIDQLKKNLPGCRLMNPSSAPSWDGGG